MSRAEKAQWVVVLLAVASLWPRMIWPGLVWRVLSWVVLAVLAGMFVWKMVIFHRRVDEMEKESEDQQTWPPAGPTPPPKP